MHFFEPENPRWIVEEALFASDTCVEDFYALTHAKNKGVFPSPTILGLVTNQY
jgi:hypothetical protein